MRTICWNCRGIGDPSMVRELKELIRECAPEVVCLLETQLSKQRVEGLTSVLGYDGGYAVGSSGRSGGLAMFWKSPISMRLLNFSKYHIDMVVTELGKEEWRLTCFYGEAQRHLLQNTWDMMSFLRGESTLPWACIGDFNEILRKEEQFGLNEQFGFREAVDLCGLCDRGYVGMDWTFEKKVAGGQFCRVRLDRALATASWSTMSRLHQYGILLQRSQTTRQLFCSMIWKLQTEE